jgi:hypothetical protein
VTPCSVHPRLDNIRGGALVSYLVPTIMLGTRVFGCGAMMLSAWLDAVLDNTTWAGVRTMHAGLYMYADEMGLT